MKKNLATALALLAIVSTLSACRGGNTPTTTPTTVAPATQPTTMPTTQATESTSETTRPTTDNGNGPLESEGNNNQATTESGTNGTAGNGGNGNP